MPVWLSILTIIKKNIWEISMNKLSKWILECYGLGGNKLWLLKHIAYVNAS